MKCQPGQVVGAEEIPAQAQAPKALHDPGTVRRIRHDENGSWLGLLDGAELRAEFRIARGAFQPEAGNALLVREGFQDLPGGDSGVVIRRAQECEAVPMPSGGLENGTGEDGCDLAVVRGTGEDPGNAG
jgi:hypothetical protein